MFGIGKAVEKGLDLGKSVLERVKRKKADETVIIQAEGQEAQGQRDYSIKTFGSAETLLIHGGAIGKLIVLWRAVIRGVVVFWSLKIISANISLFLEARDWKDISIGLWLIGGIPMAFIVGASIERWLGRR